MKRVKTGTFTSIITVLWLGLVGAAGSGCDKTQDIIKKNTKHCIAAIDEHYPTKAKDYCSSPCLRDYVKVAGSDGFRGRQLILAGVIDECEDREKNPSVYEGQATPAARHELGILLDNAYKRGQ